MARQANLPDAVREHLGSDTARAWTELEDESWLIAGNDALFVVTDTELLHLRAWTELSGASFNGESRIWTVTPVDGTTPVLRLKTRDSVAPKLAGVMAERVHHSLVHSVEASLPGGGNVRVNIRRGPDGEIFSQTIALDGATLTHDEDADVVAKLEMRARADAGITP